MTQYDTSETMDPEQRAQVLNGRLRDIVARVAAEPDSCLPHVDDVQCLDDLPKLPILRKSDLTIWQKDKPPFGGMITQNVSHIFQSPGPIYEPGSRGRDWWRLGRFLHAAGIGEGDLVQNCFSYHLTPAGMMFESGAEAVGAIVLPAGIGQTELQVRAAADAQVTAYAGTPDYLKVILEKADEQGVSLKITKAAVSGGALFPSLREYYEARGISCIQCYATADLGLIAYESEAKEGMIVDEGVIVEIVRPGTGDPVAEGEVGEVVVTSLNPDYPLIRFATGDLSAILPGQSPCGRTNLRIKGWMGRADQTAKVKGMFIRPEQVADLVSRLGVSKARVEIGREDESDTLLLKVETDTGEAGDIGETSREILKLRARVELVSPGSLPNDGKVIDDQRAFDA